MRCLQSMDNCRLHQNALNEGGKFVARGNAEIADAVIGELVAFPRGDDNGRGFPLHLVMPGEIGFLLQVMNGKGKLPG